MQPSAVIGFVNKCNTKSLLQARQLHAILLVSSNYGCSPYLQNNIISAYCRAGAVLDARLVFDKMPYRTVVSYNILLGSLPSNPTLRRFGFELYTRMGIEGVRPNGLTLGSLLCYLEDRVTGSWIHTKSVKLGCSGDAFVQTNLLNMYSKCGQIESAEKVFGTSLVRDEILWNSMVVGCVRNGKLEESLRLFVEFVRCGSFSPSPVSYSIAFQACCKMKNEIFGRAIHGRMIKSRLPLDSRLHNALLDFYCTIEDMPTAFLCFSAIPKPDIVSWNTMITGSGRTQNALIAIDLFLSLLRNPTTPPDEYTYSAIVEAAGESHGEALHAQILKLALDQSVFISTTLITMYFNQNSAESVFHR